MFFDKDCKMILIINFEIKNIWRLKMNQEFTGKLKDSLYWWLGKKKPFIVNDEYKIELLHIDRIHNSAKIRITNIKTNEIVEQEV